MRIAVAAFLALAGALQHGNNVADTGQIVRIDVIATDARGRPLDNLKPGDFELCEDGVTRTLDVRSVRAAAPGTNDIQPRIVGIFLDEYHVGPDATARVREAVTQFIEQDLRPSDRLVVLKPLDSILTIQATTDRDPAREV